MSIKYSFETVVTAVLDNHGEITATAAVLNSLCCFLIEAENRYKEIGCIATAKECNIMRNKIHESLEKGGFYD